MSHDNFDAFQTRARAAGYHEVLERQWAPDTVLDTHTHDFDVDAVVTQGEMWLICADQERHMTAGDTFTLIANMPHAERYGPEGATYWVARRRL